MKVHILLAVLLWVACSYAWQVNGVPVVVKPTGQYGGFDVSDRASGGIAVWEDSINGAWDLYGQRIDSLGRQRWGAGGLPICDTSGRQYSFYSAPDGRGGVVLSWQDGRGPNSDIYAQKVDSAGIPRWGQRGKPIANLFYNESTTRIASDGQGGAIVGWCLGDPLNTIWAQRVDSLGNFRWSPNGVPVCTVSTNSQGYSLSWMMSDGTGGAFIAWQSFPSVGYVSDIYAQRMDANGNILWPARGVPVCTADSFQSAHIMVSDEAGGVLIGWGDNRSDPQRDIYLQRIGPSGQVLWQTNGVPICTAPWSQELGGIVPDGAGNFIVFWIDYRGAYYAIYAQKIDTSGAIKWAPDGVPIFDPPWHVFGGALSDGKGGAFLVFGDTRSGLNNEDLYAQRVDSGGVRLWQPNGVPICTAPERQYGSSMIPDGTGGFLVSWMDHRNGNPDIYAQRVDSTGRVGVESRINAKADALIPMALNISPNPVRGHAAIRFAVGGRGEGAKLAIYNVLGRKVRDWDLDKSTSSSFELNWDVKDAAGKAVPAGIYFCHADMGGHNYSVQKFTVVK